MINVFQVLQNVDELFDRDELSAAPDVGWPSCFNSGVFVFEPSLDTYENLVEYAMSEGSFDGKSRTIELRNPASPVSFP